MTTMLLASVCEVNPPKRSIAADHRENRGSGGRDTGRRDCYARSMADAGKEGGGLLGDLPSHRPSVRSPRRQTAAERAAKAERAAESSPVSEARARPAGTTAPNAPEQRESG